MHSSSGDVMILVCHVILKDHLIMVSHHLVKFCGHRYCGSEYRMLLVVEEEDSTCCCFNPPLLFISK